VSPSFPICRIRGIPIRVHWAFGLLALYYLYPALLNVRGDPAGVVDAAVFIGFIVVTVVLHELAHALTALRCGGRVDSVLLWPLGGLTLLSEMPDAPRANIAVSAAGPLTNLGLAGLGFAAASAGPYARMFADINLFLGLLNLVPAPPLDGSAILTDALRARLGRARAELRATQVGVVACVGLAAYALATGWTLLLILAVLGGVGCVVKLREMRSVGFSPRPRVPASGDFRSWKLPKKELDVEIKRRRSARHADAEMRARVDRILQQISEGGIGSISDEDREFLEQSSERLRKRSP